MDVTVIDMSPHTCRKGTELGTEEAFESFPLILDKSLLATLLASFLASFLDWPVPPSQLNFLHLAILVSRDQLSPPVAELLARAEPPR
ncbi:MAG: hypothetical protein ACRD21_13245 [Vicinamibacteria bacterium]